MGFDMAAGNHRTAGKKRLGLKNIIHRRNGGNPLVEDLPAFIDQTRSVGGLYSRAGFARIHADCHLADGFSLMSASARSPMIFSICSLENLFDWPPIFKILQSWA